MWWYMVWELRDNLWILVICTITYSCTNILWFTLNQSFTYLLCIYHIIRLYVVKKIIRTLMYHKILYVYDLKYYIYDRIHVHLDEVINVYTDWVITHYIFYVVANDTINLCMWWARRWVGICSCQSRHRWFFFMYMKFG